MKSNLQEFYEERYRFEQTGNCIASLSYDKTPENRHTACLKYFKENFHGQRILEIAAGNGVVAKSLLEHCPTITTYTANDLSENRLQGLKQSVNDPRIEILQFNVEEIEKHTDEKFDAIIMLALIEHLIDPLSTMRKLRNHLTPNGIVYIDTPNIAQYGYRWKLLRGNFPSTASKNQGLTNYDGTTVTMYDEGHLHYFTFGSLMKMLTDLCGYQGVTKVPYSSGYTIINRSTTYKLSQIMPNLISPVAVVAK